VKRYQIDFSPGVLYATQMGTIDGDGVQNGNETGIDAFSAPSGISCSSTSVLSSLTVLGVMKITAP